MSSDELHHVAEAVRQVQIERAVMAGDLDAVIARAFEIGFGRDGLGVLPWIEQVGDDGALIVCPGGLVARSRSSHRCRFVSVDDVWVWDSGLLMREDKRSSPGVQDGFRAIAVLPAVDGIEIDVVTGRARAGGHTVEHVVSYEVRRGELVEVSQRRRGRPRDAMMTGHSGRDRRSTSRPPTNITAADPAKKQPNTSAPSANSSIRSVLNNASNEAAAMTRPAIRTLRRPARHLVDPARSVNNCASRSSRP